ncbi:MAG: hypothetical protein PVH12_03425 [Candidatus Bathyarchaeota archaeon]|jgi:hypothetical protein
MVKCWNCENLKKVYSGVPTKGMLFGKKSYRCKVKGIMLEKYYELHDEKQCSRYKEGRYWIKNRQIFKIQSQRSD